MSCNIIGPWMDHWLDLHRTAWGKMCADLAELEVVPKCPKNLPQISISCANLTYVSIACFARSYAMTHYDTMTMYEYLFFGYRWMNKVPVPTELALWRQSPCKMLWWLYYDDLWLSMSLLSCILYSVLSVENVIMYDNVSYYVIMWYWNIYNLFKLYYTKYLDIYYYILYCFCTVLCVFLNAKFMMSFWHNMHVALPSIPDS